MQQLTTEEAKAFAASGAWKSWTDRERALFQLSQEKLSMDFGAFHGSVEKALGRPVWTHEFASASTLLLELLGLRKRADLQEVIAKAEELAPGKVLVVGIGKQP